MNTLLTILVALTLIGLVARWCYHLGYAAAELHTRISLARPQPRTLTAALAELQMDTDSVLLVQSPYKIPPAELLHLREQIRQTVQRPVIVLDNGWEVSAIRLVDVPKIRAMHNDK